MDKFILRQYSDLVREIEEDQRRIEKLEERLRRIEADGTVIDSVKGGEGGIQHFTIEGYPINDYSKTKTSLLMRKMRLQDNLNECIDMVDDVTEFVNNIEDAHIRRIIKLRFLDGLSWLQVSMKIGDYNTEDSVRMAFNRFMDSEK